MKKLLIQPKKDLTNFSKPKEVAAPSRLLATKKLTLKFQFAARSQVELASNSFSVAWNGKKLKTFVPKDYKIHTTVLPILATIGTNVLSFLSEGKTDSLGATINNVELMNHGKNMVRNGGFEQGHNVGKGWNSFEELAGWKSEIIQVGNGPIYNLLWSDGDHVCQLNSGKNSRVYQ